MVSVMVPMCEWYAILAGICACWSKPSVNGNETREREKIRQTQWASKRQVRWVRSFFFISIRTIALCGHRRKRERYLRVHYCRACCWSTWLCWRWPAELANATQVLDCLDECTCVVRSVVLRHQPVPIGCPRICNGNRWPGPFRVPHNSANPSPCQPMQREATGTFACEKRERRGKIVNCEL